MFKVEEKRVKIQQELGKGAFGVVYKVTEVRTYTEFALKDVWPCVNHVLASCEERRLYSQARIHVASREVEIMRKLSHDCVLTFCGADQYVDEQGGLHTLILTEYCHCGNLNERLHRPSSASVNFKWMQQIAAGLAYVH